MNNLVILPLIAPFLIGVILLFFARHVKVQQALSLIAGLGVIVFSTILLFDVQANGIRSLYLSGWEPPYGITLVADSLSVLLVLFVGIVLTASILYSYKGLDIQRKNHYFYPLVQFLATGVIGAFLTGDIFNMFVFFEVLLISSYALIVLGGEKVQLKESIQYMLVNMVSSAFFVITVAYLYSITGTLNMADLSQKVAEINQPGIVTVIAFLFLIVFGMKAAMFPLYFWLPGSYASPPPVIGAIFAGLLTKVGIYSIIRIFTIIFYHHPEITHVSIGVLATLTIIAGSIGAVAYNDMNKIIVYNVIIGVGYILVGLSSFNQAGVLGGVYYLLHDMLVKVALFLLIGAIVTLTGKTKLKDASGLIKDYPLLGWSIFIAALSLAGIPPFSGFFGKLLLVQGGLEAGQYFFVVIILLSSLFVLYSMMKIFFQVILGEERLPIRRKRGNIKGYVYPSFLLLVLSFLMGFGTESIYPFLADATSTLLNPEIYIEAVLKE